jgi:hypothetical protein
MKSNYEQHEFNNDKYSLFLKIALDYRDNIRFVIEKSWIEIIRLLTKSKLFRFMVNDSILTVAEKLKELNPKTYNLLSIEEKIIILEYLTDSAIDTKFIRDIIAENIEKRNEMNKEKNSIEAELKQIESRKRELERQEKYTQPKQKIEALNKRLTTLVEDNPQLSRAEINKLRKELESEREQFKSVLII